MRAIAHNSLARTVLLALALLTGLSAGDATPPSRAIPAGELWLDPSAVRVPIGETTALTVRLDNVTGVYGVDVVLAFDQTVLAVVDADAGTPGVQVATGACPAPEFVVANTADNGAGTIEYVASQLGTAPCDGGIAATITVECLVEGESDVTFTSSDVRDRDGQAIAHITQPSTVTCSDAYDVFLPLVLRAY
jgi:hypothetical protein